MSLVYLSIVAMRNMLTHFVSSFGETPQRVEIMVDLMKNGGKRNLKSFTVEMAPLDLMPVAIHLFLDMVSNGIWDNTVFLHHHEVEHVIAAAPLDAITQEMKNESLGRMEIGFPEYSHQFPHEKYTLGFAGQGPTFYINTFNNTVDHGPGGQLHHTLPSDADPCFAKVVEGLDVVDELMRLGLKHKPTGGKGNHPWVEASHSWTRLISAKILTP
jgi:cyclophilin family peptidyl-prolyl cis-trans isomerase